MLNTGLMGSTCYHFVYANREKIHTWHVQCWAYRAKI